MHKIIIQDNLSHVITKVEINQAIQDKLDQDIKAGLFDKEVRELIAFWALEIKEIGFEEYLNSPFAESLQDHSLRGNRQQERSIYLNTKGGRLIYKYYKKKIIVKVIKITSDHNYS